MTIAPETPRRSIHRWIRRGFLSWAVISTLWLANSFRTQGVDHAFLQSSPAIMVRDEADALEFLPTAPTGSTALIFFCGSGVSAHAYAPLLRPIAEAGYAVFIVKLPLRFALLESHKRAAVERARTLLATHPEITRWVVSGHSLGGALACRWIQTVPAGISSMVLIGTTHPKSDDLSSVRMPVTKVYASNDGVAPPDKTLANSRLLPAHTRWVEVKGGNHSQFGHYGHQLFDGGASIDREEQQRITRSALLDALSDAAARR